MLDQQTKKPGIRKARLDQAYEKNKSLMVHQMDGSAADTYQNFYIGLRYDPIFGKAIRQNRFTEKIELSDQVPWPHDSQGIGNTDLSFLLRYLEIHYGLSSENHLMHALRMVGAEQSYHPVQEYLNRLVWDGVPRIRFALHHFLGADICDYNENCLRIFMAGAIKRVFEPGSKFELMLVLTGSQGAGKSTFFRFLAGREEWFTDDVRNLSDEKVFTRLRGHWFVELSEMVATNNAKSLEEIKSFLSREKDNYKYPYDRYAEDHPRQCVFAGTTNQQDFLPMDRSGNRRFLPVQVHAEKAECHILDDAAASRAYIDQMWAEMMVCYRGGHCKSWLTAEDEKNLLKEQEIYVPEDTKAGVIYAFMERFKGDKVCSRQLFECALNHRGEEPKSVETQEICRIVNSGIDKRLLTGWKRLDSPRKFERYGTQRGWIRI